MPAETAPVVHCRWSEPHVPPAAAVRLWRLVDPGAGNPREVVYRSDDLAVQEFTDTAVRPGHVYRYAVQLLGEHGRIVGRSRVETVRLPGVPPGLEAIELECELAVGAEHVGCRWTSPTSAAGGDGRPVAFGRRTGPRARGVVPRRRSDRLP